MTDGEGQLRALAGRLGGVARGAVERAYGPARPGALAEGWRDLRRWALEVRLPALVGAGAAPVAAVLLFGGSRLAGQAAAAAYLLIALYGLHLLSVQTGQPSLGQAAFLGAGAYATALLRERLGVDGLIAAPVSALFAGGLGLCVASGTARLPTPFVALATWALGWLGFLAAGAFPGLGGGAAGITLGGPLRLDWPALGLQVELDERAHLLIASGLCATTVLLLSSARRSRLGLGWAALRGGAGQARALGLEVARIRRWAFFAAAALAGLSGSLSAQMEGVIDPARYSPVRSLELLVAVLIGARLGLWGPPLGLLLVEGLPAAASRPGSGLGVSTEQLQTLLVALLSVIALLVIRGLFRSAGPAAAGDPPAAPTSPAESTDARARPTEAHWSDRATALSARGLRRAYAGVLALDGVDLEVARGEVRGVIGPNGSGKSTLLRCLAGAATPDSGRVLLGGRDVSRLGESARVRAGLVRTFQRTSLLPSLTAGQQVELGLSWSSGGGSWARALFQTPGYRAQARERPAAAERILSLAGLDGLAGMAGASLPAGRQRLLQVAAAVACLPHVLLLDEPSAGMSRDEVSLLERALAALAGAGLTLVVVEHNLGLLRRVADRVTVLDQGRVLITGSPAQVARDPAVRRAYLGDGRIG